MLLRLLNALLARACRLFGHADDIHDTGFVQVRYCVFCRDMRIHNLTNRVLDVWLWCPTDAAGRPTAAPHRVLVREVNPSSLTENDNGR